MSMENVNSIHAVIALDAGAVPVVVASRGFVAAIGAGGVVRNGVGDYTLNLVDGLSVAESAISGMLSSAGTISATRPTVTTINVLTKDVAGVAQDLDFWMLVHRLSNSL